MLLFAKYGLCTLTADIELSLKKLTHLKNIQASGSFPLAFLTVLKCFSHHIEMLISSQTQVNKLIPTSF